MSKTNQDIVKETYARLGIRHWKGFSLMMKLLKVHGLEKFLTVRKEVESRLFYLKNPLIYFFALLLRQPDPKKQKILQKMKQELLGKTRFFSDEDRTEIEEEIAKEERQHK